MNRCVDYQHKQCQGGGSYNQNDDNSSFGGLSVSQVYVTNTLPTLSIGPALAPPVNENLYGQSDSLDQDQ